MAIGNSIGEQTTGITGFTGTTFTGTPVTQHLVQIGGATSSTLAEVAIGTSGQVLTSNGAGVAPSFQTVTAGGGLLTATGQLTSAQIKALNGTPVQIVAAQGVNKIIRIIHAYASFVYGGSNVFVAGSGQTINIYYATTTNFGVVLTNGNIVSTIDRFTDLSGSYSGAQSSSYSNIAINWYNPIGAEISGNAANDNVINWSVSYIVSDK